MRKLSLLQIYLLSVVFIVVGGWLCVEFRAWRGKEDSNFLYLLGTSIGSAIGFTANHRRHARHILCITIACTVATCLFGNFRVAILESL